MRRHSIIFLLCFAALMARAENPKVITPQEAKDHAGERVTVAGTIDEVASGKSGVVFLNMGGKFPREVFMVFIRRGLGDQETWQKWEGKKAWITGAIKLYKGHPEIAISDADQVRDHP